MIILEDTRQQEQKHNSKHKYFVEQGIEIRRTKLYVGDYTLPTDQSVCVDSKFSILELAEDICGKSHERFRNECIRAQESDIKLYILVENAGCEIYNTGIYNKTITSLEELHSWKNPRLFIMENSSEMIGSYKNGRPMYRKVQKYPKATRGEQLMKACMTMEKKYGVKFLFCRPSEAGLKVLELLGVNADGGE